MLYSYSLFQSSPNTTDNVIVNTLGWSRKEVIEIAADSPIQSPSRKKPKSEESATQIDFTGKTLGINIYISGLLVS